MFTVKAQTPAFLNNLNSPKQGADVDESCVIFSNSWRNKVLFFQRKGCCYFVEACLSFLCFFSFFSFLLFLELEPPPRSASKFELVAFLFFSFFSFFTFFSFFPDVSIAAVDADVCCCLDMGMTSPSPLKALKIPYETHRNTKRTMFLCQSRK